MPSKSIYTDTYSNKKETLKNTYVVFYTQKLTHRIIGQNLNGQNLPRAHFSVSVCMSFSLARALALCMSGAFVTESARVRGFRAPVFCVFALQVRKRNGEHFEMQRYICGCGEECSRSAREDEDHGSRRWEFVCSSVEVVVVVVVDRV